MGRNPQRSLKIVLDDYFPRSLIESGGASFVSSQWVTCRMPRTLEFWELNSFDHRNHKQQWRTEQMNYMLLTTKQVHERTGLSMPIIRELIRQKKLHGINAGVGKKFIFMVPEESLAAFLRGEVPDHAKDKATRKTTRQRLDANVPKVFR